MIMGTGPLRRLYHAAEGQLAFISGEDDATFTKFVQAAGQAGLASDARFADKGARAANADALVAVLEPVFASKTADEWERTLTAAGVGCVRADTYPSSGKFWLNDPHVKANGLDPIAHHMVMGDYQRWGPIVKFEKNPGTYGGGMLAGEHTDQILGELGFDQAQITELRDRKVVWSEEPVYP